MADKRSDLADLTWHYQRNRGARAPLEEKYHSRQYTTMEDHDALMAEREKAERLAKSRGAGRSPSVVEREPPPGRKPPRKPRKERAPGPAAVRMLAHMALTNQPYRNQVKAIVKRGSKERLDQKWYIMTLASEIMIPLAKKLEELADGRAGDVLDVGGTKVAFTPDVFEKAAAHALRQTPRILFEDE